MLVSPVNKKSIMSSKYFFPKAMHQKVLVLGRGLGKGNSDLSLPLMGKFLPFLCLSLKLEQSFWITVGLEFTYSSASHTLNQDSAHSAFSTCFGE